VESADSFDPVPVADVVVVEHQITADDSSTLTDGEITRDEIAEFISDVTRHEARPEGVQRVAARLAAAGWPLAGGDGSTPPDEGVSLPPRTAAPQVLVSASD